MCRLANHTAAVPYVTSPYTCDAGIFAIFYKKPLARVVQLKLLICVRTFIKVHLLMNEKICRTHYIPIIFYSANIIIQFNSFIIIIKLL